MRGKVKCFNYLIDDDVIFTCELNLDRHHCRFRLFIYNKNWLLLRHETLKNIENQSQHTRLNFPNIFRYFCLSTFTQILSKNLNFFKTSQNSAI